VISPASFSYCIYYNAISIWSRCVYVCVVVYIKRSIWACVWLIYKLVGKRIEVCVLHWQMNGLNAVNAMSYVDGVKGTYLTHNTTTVHIPSWWCSKTELMHCSNVYGNIIQKISFFTQDIFSFLKELSLIHWIFSKLRVKIVQLLR